VICTPALTRRRDRDAHQETWLIYFGDVRVGSIAIRSGNPADTGPWGWSCGFYPGSHPREHQSGTAATFDQARADFEAAWLVSYRNGLRPIFRHGAGNAIGRPRNIGAPIEASACRMIGALVSDRGWPQ
jgi:hypothetical protein